MRASGEAVANGLHRYEELLRDAHIAGLRLSLDLRLVQDQAGLSAIAAHQLFNRLDEAQFLVSGALGHAAVGHSLARKVAPLAGIDPKDYGDKTPPEEDEETRRSAGNSRLPDAA